MKKCNISPVASPVRKAEKQKRSYIIKTLI